MGIFSGLFSSDEPDWDEEVDNAKEKYETAVSQYKSYTQKLRSKYSSINKHGADLNKLAQEIKANEDVIKQMVNDKAAMAYLKPTEQDYILNAKNFIKPITAVTNKDTCTFDVDYKKEWDKSPPSLEDGIAFALLGPLGVLMNRAPTGYDEFDVEEIQEAISNVIKETGKLKKRITTATKKSAELVKKKKACKQILKIIDWYKTYCQGGKQ